MGLCVAEKMKEERKWEGKRAEERAEGKERNQWVKRRETKARAHGAYTLDGADIRLGRT